MKKEVGGWKTLLVLMLCIAVALVSGAVSAESGIEKDEDGGIWNYNEGTYTDPDGSVYQITQDGVPDDSGSATVKNSDGSMTVITSDKDPVQQNEDGSITVKSGEMVVDLPPETTRPPITGDAWEAELASVAQRNGAETPTVYFDPEPGNVIDVEVVYMGIGRSMIRLNGQNVLVNTVDLKWKTEAPDDQVLAVVNAPRNGYAWMRKEPSNSIKNTKIMQVRTDSVVRVISPGKNWTLVDYNGTRAYVQSSSLEFFQIFLTGTSVLSSVFVMMKPSLASPVTTIVYPPGTPVTLFSVTLYSYALPVAASVIGRSSNV